MGYVFEWDPEKAKINFEKHGVRFEVAMTVFEDEDSITCFDYSHSEDEDRFLDIGTAKNEIVLVLCYTEREDRFELSMQDRLTAKKEDFMNKISKHVTNGKSEEMLSHYDFSGRGVRGKYAKRYREGVTVHLLGKNEDTRLVMLDDDMGKIFPDAKSVNDALRHLVKAMPKRKAA